MRLVLLPNAGNKMQKKDILLNWAHQHVENITTLRVFEQITDSGYTLRQHDFPFKYRTLRWKKNLRKPNGTPFKRGCKSWKMTHCAAGHMMPEQHKHTQTDSHPYTHTHTLAHVSACISTELLQTNALNEATVGTAVPVLSREIPLNAKQILKAFPLFERIDLFVFWPNTCSTGQQHN